MRGFIPSTIRLELVHLQRIVFIVMSASNIFRCYVRNSWGAVRRSTQLPSTYLRQSSSTSPTSPSSDASLPRANRSKMSGGGHSSANQAGPSPPSASTPPSSSSADSEPLNASSVFQTMSKATLIGRTGGPARIQDFDYYGGQCATLSIATNHFARDSDADSQRVGTQWHYVQVYDSTPGYSFISSLPAGTQVYVEGSLRIVQRERDGVPMTYVNVSVSKSHGTFRVLRRPYRTTDTNEPGDTNLSDGSTPF